MSSQIPAQMNLACSQCSRMFAQSDLVQVAGNWVCGACKPAYLSRVMAGDAAAPSATQYAGVGIRFGARLIDGLIFIVPFLIILMLMMPNLMQTSRGGAAAANGGVATLFQGTFLLVALFFGLFYEVLMLHYWGATLGKMACGLRVVRSDASGLGWGVSFGRYFMYNIVISLIPFLNYILLLTTAIMAGVDGQKRGLHDRVCDTRVVFKRSLA